VLGRRDLAVGFEEAAVVEPVDPLERGNLDRLEGTPWPSAPDNLVDVSQRTAALAYVRSLFHLGERHRCRSVLGVGQ
jgi:hypothetical protein